jgi:uncharacterized protein YcbK (DUF882 family)
MFDKGFERWEFACKCGCGFDTVDVETLEVLEELKRWYGQIVIISSGCRCREYNEQIQKEKDPDYTPYSSRSKHMEGRGVDFKVMRIPSIEVYKYLNRLYPDKYGIGFYKTFTHFDSRSYMARWGLERNTNV